jgi:hypothetical protein
MTYLTAQRSQARKLQKTLWRSSGNVYPDGECGARAGGTEKEKTGQTQ